MGCGASKMLPADVSENIVRDQDGTCENTSNSNTMDVVGAMMQAWGEGKLSDPVQVAKFFAEDCVLDAKTDISPDFKVYFGVAGCVEWVKFLDGFDFIDFKPEMSAMGEDKVAVRATYNVRIKMSMNPPMESSDMQYWTIKNGKISHAQFYFGNQPEWKKLLQPPSANIAVVQKMFAAWGSKQLIGKDGMKIMEDICHEDVTMHDKNAEHTPKELFTGKETTGYKAIIDTMKRQEDLVDWKDFTAAMSDGFGGNKVNCEISYRMVNKKTGKETACLTDVQIWEIENGKVRNIHYIASDVDAISAIF